MRWWPAVHAIGCAAPPHHRVVRRCPPPKPSPWHARIAATSRTVDATRARFEQLGPVVVLPIAVSPAPGAASRGAELEPGFPLPATFASWLHVHLEHPIALDGWVPVSARGMFYREDPALAAPDVLAATTIVRLERAADAPVVAVLDAGVAAQISGQVGEWATIEAEVERVHVRGWGIVPPPRPRGVRTFDFSDDVIEGELIRPDAAAVVDDRSCPRD